MTPYLSIVIPAYKEKESLPELLKSIFSSSFQNFEVIIGDDASPTPLERLLGSKFSDKNNLQWVRLEKNQGPAAARNRAAKLAKGEILVFFDADVRLYPDTLEKIAAHFKKDADLHALTGVWDKKQKSKALFPQYKALRDWSYWINERNRGEYYYLFSTRCAAIKRKIFERLGGFNSNFRQMEDVELTYRIAQRYAIIFCDDVKVHHEFEDFWTVAKKYFWRSFYWSKLYSKRRKFDPVATTSWEMLTAVYGVFSLPLIVLGVFSNLFLILGLVCFLAHLFFLRKFLGFVFKEKGLFFTFYSIAAGLALYYFIALGGAWSIMSRGNKGAGEQGNKGTGEQGNKGTEEQRNRGSRSAGLEVLQKDVPIGTSIGNVVKAYCGIGKIGKQGNRGTREQRDKEAREQEIGKIGGQEKKKRKRWSDGLMALIIFCVVFSMGTILSADYGMVWDEPDNIFSGGVYFNFLTRGFDQKYFQTNLQSSSFFGDKIYPLDRNLVHLPPFANILASGLTYFLSYRLGLFNEIVCFHLTSVFFLALAAGFIYLFARLLGFSKWTSVFCGFSLWLYPHFFGHGHSNIKDIGQASLFLVSLYFLAKAVLRNRLLWVFFGAVVFGLAFDIKFNAVYLPLIWNLWVLSLLIFQKDVKNLSWRWWLKANLILAVVGFLTIYLFWPYLWDQPLLKMSEVINYFTTVGKGYFFFFNGKVYQAGIDYLWYYPWVYYLLVTPAVILGLALMGIFGAIRELIKEKKFALILLFVWFLPLGRAFLPQANLYDGIRHFLEVAPAIILLAGVGFEMIYKLIKRYSLVMVILPLFVFLIFVNLLLINFNLHPYQTAYYNFLAGGTKGAQDKFDLDLEGLSAKEAMDILHQKEGRIKVYFPLVAHLAQYYLLPGDELVGDAVQADFMVIINKKTHTGQKHFQELIKNLDEEHELYEVIERNGGEIGRIYRLISN